jgi:heparan-alpha-glucosaminide N-acetyltransferase
MSGRIILHYKEHKTRLKKWGIFSFILLLIGGILCGFSQNDGVIPLNKNLW